MSESALGCRIIIRPPNLPNENQTGKPQKIRKRKKRKRSLQCTYVGRKRRKYKEKAKKNIHWNLKPVEGSNLKTWNKIQNLSTLPIKKTKTQVFKNINYTDKEYESVCQSHAWAKEDTDFFIDLCKQYQCRFPIIHDRYNFLTKGKKRTKEELKSRFYEVQRKLSEKFPTKHDQAFKGVEFDQEKEKKRLAQLNKLLNRSALQNQQITTKVLARRKIDQVLRDKKRHFKDIKLKLKEYNQFIINRCNKNDITKQDLVLTMGGVFGYNCGYGVSIKDDIRRIPLPKDGILTQMPSAAVIRCNRKPVPLVTTQKHLMTTPLKFTANCGANNKKCVITHPMLEDLEYQIGKNSIGYKLTERAEKKVDKLLGPDFAEKIKAPTLINAQIFDKFRTDVVTLTVLERLVEDKEKELQNLTSKKDVTDFVSK